MDRAYEGNETRQLVLELDMIPVVPPKSNRLELWDQDRAFYKSATRPTPLPQTPGLPPHILAL